MSPRSIALTVAGSDSSGGAGIQADLKTYSALGVYGASVLTALTAQNTRGVTAVHVVPPDFVRAQLAAVTSDLDIGAIKTGMLANTAIVDVVAAELARLPGIPLVVDPVMIATSGDPLLEPTAVDAMLLRLLPLATLVTPNLAEAARLSGQPLAGSLDEMADQGRAILSCGCSAVLVKGGHGDTAEATDVLVLPRGRIRLYSAARIATRNTHGTGCTLSAAIVAYLALGDELETAVERAKRYLTEALRHGVTLEVGKGHGPVDHLFDVPTHPSSRA